MTVQQIEKLPASRQAVNQLAELGITIQDWIPSVLQLAQWAVEEAPTYKLDAAEAEPVLNDLMAWAQTGKPGQATLLLLDVDDPETEVPPELMYQKPEELAAGMLNLLQNAAA